MLTLASLLAMAAGLWVIFQDGLHAEEERQRALGSEALVSAEVIYRHYASLATALTANAVLDSSTDHTDFSILTSRISQRQARKLSHYDQISTWLSSVTGPALPIPPLGKGPNTVNYCGDRRCTVGYLSLASATTLRLLDAASTFEAEVEALKNIIEKQKSEIEQLQSAQDRELILERAKTIRIAVSFIVISICFVGLKMAAIETLPALSALALLHFSSSFFMGKLRIFFFMVSEARFH